jgi:hypothetical protein
MNEALFSSSIQNSNTIPSIYKLKYIDVKIFFKNYISILYTNIDTKMDNYLEKVLEVTPKKIKQLKAIYTK